MIDFRFLHGLLQKQGIKTQVRRLFEIPPGVGFIPEKGMDRCSVSVSGRELMVHAEGLVET